MLGAAFTAEQPIADAYPRACCTTIKCEDCAGARLLVHLLLLARVRSFWLLRLAACRVSHHA